ncbi:MAG: ADP-forming succinate--CoA ligase subunit beta [Alphaproteobacteria bacterium]|nr:ADP-forming succinate--CoA ligase subunit beta [Alphaproteobacteria bacterium]|tara:strand:- start:2997 stop:4163 length:1167 start_codon:yes stop_codon:yes gene_type:complete
MNIHEYQAKQLLSEYGVPTPKGIAVTSPDEITQAIKDMGGPIWVIKAQIHAGGRGKAGGVKVCKSYEEATSEATQMFGKNLITHQTTSAGKEVNRIYVEEGCNIDNEFYLGCLVNRASGQVTIMASQEGGVDIEEVAANNPEKIININVDPVTGYQSFHGRRIAFALGLTGPIVKDCISIIGNIYKAFCETDSSILEINPLVLTNEKKLIALDAKMNFDDNALFRHKNIEDMRDETEEEPAELEAAKFDLSYIKLDGNIGCMVNGAGLAMATMDIIKLSGGEPANFLDVGGGATKEKVSEAFKIILSDKSVKGILVNIFGGIMRCDVIAEGIITAAHEVKIDVPLVVRLEGTNVNEGKNKLKNSGIAVISADDLEDAAKKIVKLTLGT